MVEYTALDFYTIKILSLKQLENIILKDEKASKIYEILKNNVAPDINALGINTYYIPIPMSSSGGYEIAFENDYITNKYKQPNDKLYLSFIFYLDKKAKKIEDVKPHICVGFYPNMNKDIKTKIIDIFEKYLFGFFYWNGSNRTYPIIKYKKDNDIKKINKANLKDDDEYPYLYINIKTYYDIYKYNENNKNYNMIKNFMLSLFKNYDAVLEPICSDNIIFTVYCFEYNDKIIQKVKDFLESLDFIKTINMAIYYNEKQSYATKYYWEYKN